MQFNIVKYIHVIVQPISRTLCILYCCCCCCQVTSVVSDSVRSHRWQPTRLRHPWDSPGKTTGVGCHFLLQCMKVKSESEVVQLCPTLRDLMDCSPPGSSVHGIFILLVLFLWRTMTDKSIHLKITRQPLPRLPTVLQDIL